VSFGAWLRGHQAITQAGRVNILAADRQCKKPPRQCRGGFLVGRHAFASLIS
jgi:hypothetical protein